MVHFAFLASRLLPHRWPHAAEAGGHVISEFYRVGWNPPRVVVTGPSDEIKGGMIRTGQGTTRAGTSPGPRVLKTPTPHSRAGGEGPQPQLNVDSCGDKMAGLWPVAVNG